MVLSEAAARAGVAPATLRRWGNDGVIPQYDGEWTPARAAASLKVSGLTGAPDGMGPKRSSGGTAT